MTPRLPWPHSLAGQMALLIALALFAAQAVNFGLVLRDRANFRREQIARPIAARIADALDREADGARAIRADRGRIRRLPGDFVPRGLARRDDVATELREQLTELGVAVGRIDTGLRAWNPTDAHVHRGGRVFAPQRFRDAADRPPDQALLIAVEQPGRGWLSLTVPWGGGLAHVVWRLLAQTALLYGIVLIPVLWIARRISRPLRALTLAAQDYRPSDTRPLPLHGPGDVRALTAAFDAMRGRVTAMLDEKDRMLGAIGHDLRTPLAALRVRIESVEDEADRTRMADTIAEMNRTLDDILSLARLGRPSEPATDTDLAALVDAVVEDFRDLGAPVSFAETERCRVRLRPSLMRRAVRNLIENAVKYGGAAQVELTAAEDRATIAVLDRGPGIPPDRITDVFDAFTRLETSRNRDTGGVGLGLALARAIVEEAGGRLTLENREGGGLAATIVLPRSSAT